MRVSFVTQSQVSEIVHHTLCPTWDQTLIFENVCIYGSPEITEKSPPRVVLELFDRDPVVRLKAWAESIGANDYGIIWVGGNSERDRDFDDGLRVNYKSRNDKEPLRELGTRENNGGRYFGLEIIFNCLGKLPSFIRVFNF